MTHSTTIHSTTIRSTTTHSPVLPLHTRKNPTRQNTCTLAVMLGVLSAAQASTPVSNVPQNLKGFESVCVHATAHFDGKENMENSRIYKEEIVSRLKEEGIRVAPSGCQHKALTASKLLNLTFTARIQDGSGEPTGVLSTSMHAWLSQEGRYKNVTIWQTSSYGQDENRMLSLGALELLIDAIQLFLSDWKKTTH